MTHNNYLIHYGVKGMKWGVRHDPPRVASARNRYKSAQRAYSKKYDDARKYSSRHPISQYISGTKAHSESNKRWEETHYAGKRAKTARQKLKTEKRIHKTEKLRNKLEAKSAKNAERYKAEQKEHEKAIRDLKRNGVGSTTWQNKITNDIKEAQKRAEGKDFATQVFAGIEASSKRYNVHEMRRYTTEVEISRDIARDNGAKWTARNKKLMNMTIGKDTTKRDVRRAYRGR